MWVVLLTAVRRPPRRGSRTATLALIAALVLLLVALVLFAASAQWALATAAIMLIIVDLFGIYLCISL